MHHPLHSKRSTAFRITDHSHMNNVAPPVMHISETGSLNFFVYIPSTSGPIHQGRRVRARMRAVRMELTTVSDWA